MKLINNLITNANDASKLVKKDSPAILTGIGCIGFVVTCVMVAKASPHAKDILDEVRELNEEKEENKPKAILNEVVAVAPIYAPAAITGVASLACFLYSYKISADRIAALGAAYSLTEKKLTEYQQKVIETIGKKKEENIQSEIAKEHIEETEEDQPAPIDDLLMDGKQLFFDDFSKRYFRATYQELYDAKEEINLELASGMPCEVNRWYERFDELESLNDIVGETYGWLPGQRMEYRTYAHTCRDGYTTCTAIVIDAGLCAEELCRTY